MTTLGDIVAIAAMLLGLSATAWGAVVLTMLLARQRVQATSARIQAHPFKVGFAGLGMTLVIVLAGIVLLNLDPLSKTLGFLIILIQALMGVIGAASVASAAAEQIQINDPSMSRYTAMVKASLLVVAMASLPVIGWFVVTPILLSFGTHAVLVRRTRPAVQAVSPEAS